MLFPPFQIVLLLSVSLLGAVSAFPLGINANMGLNINTGLGLPMMGGPSITCAPSAPMYPPSQLMDPMQPPVPPYNQGYGSYSGSNQGSYSSHKTESVHATYGNQQSGNDGYMQG